VAPSTRANPGLTLIHEALRFRDEAVAENWPGRYEAQRNQVTAELLRRGQTDRLLMSQISAPRSTGSRRRRSSR
jgi:hypothetical protein